MFCLIFTIDDIWNISSTHEYTYKFNFISQVLQILGMLHSSTTWIINPLMKEVVYYYNSM